MKLFQYAGFIFLCLLFSCNKKSKTGLHAVLNDTNLAQQFFLVDTNRDTTLITKGGCIIKIPRGSLESNSADAKLEIKEALNIQDMLRGGLTTTSGTQNLSSGGMLYINAAEGYKISIKKGLEILIPTKTFNPDMQVYKGEKGNDGKIDWQNPKSLPLDSTLTKINTGENIFKTNCASCHKINDDFTGPPLYGVTYRRSKKWLYDFTRNPEKMINSDTLMLHPNFSREWSVTSKDVYASCLFNTWKPTVMTAFPNLSNADLDNIYSYIKAETDKNPKANNDYGKTCCDSCEVYQRELNSIYNEKDGLTKSDQKINNIGGTTEFPVDLPLTSTYYTIRVEAFGWFNIDCLMKNYEDCKISELFVKIQGEHKLEYNVSLIIPSRKVFVEGGKLDDFHYGFSESNGKISLPQGEQCYIIAFAEYNDKIIYGKASFISGIKQTVTVNSKETSEENMLKEFASLDLTDLNLKTRESKNDDEIKREDEIRKIEEKIDSLKKYLPQNCDCQFPPASTSPMPAVTSDPIFQNIIQR